MAGNGVVWKSNRTFNLLIGLVLLATALRAWGDSYQLEDASRWSAAGLLLLFTLLLLLSYWPPFNRRFRPAPYFIAQSATTLALLSLRPFLDYYAVLFGILSVQGMQLYPQATGFKWTAAFSLLAGIQVLIGQGWPEGLPLALLYTALFFILAYLVTLRNRAERAQEESQFLLEELRTAHAQLQEQAAQAEELAVVKERNRLARDLHDSVTQALYSQTLYAQAAANQLEAGDTAEALSHVHEIRQSSLQALQEMRLLIFELRPPVLQEEGLVSALQARLDSVEGRAGLKTSLNVESEIRLPPPIEEAVYWICQEALNNVLKHAGAQQVSVSLNQEKERFLLQIEDDGAGIDASGDESMGMGLRGMAERAEQLGGSLVLDGRPGQGANVRVEVPL